MARKKSSTRSLVKKGDFVIDHRTNNDLLFDPVVDGERKGRGLVPRDYSKFPQEMFAAPSEMKVIPESEWDARINEQEEQQSSLQHIRDRGANGKMIPALDQGSKGFCHDAATEVLTERGWVAWPDYNWSDPIGTVNPSTHAMEFQAPFQKHVYEYDGELVHSTNGRIDFGVTPDHRMLVRKWDERRRTLSDRYTFQRAGEIGWYAGMMAAPRGWMGTELVEVEVPGDRRYDGDDFMAMLGLVVSDGYAGGSEKTRNLVSFASFREGTRPVISSLAARLRFREAPSRTGVWNRWSAGALASWLRANAYSDGDTGSRAKRVPEIVKCASVRQIKIFLSYFDDRSRDSSQFYSTSRRLIDDLQELHLRIGKRSSIRKVAAKDVPYAGNASGVIRSGEGYVLTVAESDHLSLERKRHIERDHYKGLVYCAAVPNGTLVTRRNGSVLLSGNCWAHSTTMAIMMTRARDNQPYVRLSAYAVACILKGYRDQGGWCGESAVFDREKGVPSVQFWPEKSMARANDNPKTWENAALHRVTEDWVDLTRPIYGQNLTRQQIATCLLNNIPVAVDYNEWGHSINAIRWVRIEAGVYVPLILNSWSDAWGKDGTGLINRNWDVDGAVAFRESIASAA